MALDLNICILLILAAIWVVTHVLLMPHPIKGIPYRRFSRFLPWGELATLGIHNWRTDEVFDWLSQQCLDHKSPIVQLFLPNFSTTHPVVVVADLPEIYNITTRRTHEIDRAAIMLDWFGLLVPQATIGLKSKDRVFQESRRLWNVMVSPRFLHKVAANRFYEVALDLCYLWQRKLELISEKDAFEAQDDIRRATLDAIWNISTGLNMGLLDCRKEAVETSESLKRKNGAVVFEPGTSPEFYTVLQTTLVCFDWVLQGISPRFYTWFFRTTGILTRAEKKLNKYIYRTIAAARCDMDRNTTLSVPRSALDEVLKKDLFFGQEKTGLTRSATSDDKLRDELQMLLITGHETTASSISWGIKYLTDNPRAQQRLRQELYSKLSSSEASLPTAADIATTNLPYLDAVISEILRCSNTGPVSFRETLTPCRMLGHDLPAGTPLILVTAGPSYDLGVMPKTLAATRNTNQKSLTSVEPLTSFAPRIFAPERWILDGKFCPDAIFMLPFSAGSRGCFGKKIALLEMRIILAVLVMRFELSLLAPHLSKYTAKDGLTRRPTCCYIRPKLVDRPAVSSSLPT